MILVHTCVRGRISVHLLEKSRCVAFMFKGWDSGAFSWGMTGSVHTCVRGRMSVHIPEEWRFRCILVWGVRFRCIYLRVDDVSAFMCLGWDFGAFIWGMMISVHSCLRGKCNQILPLTNECTGIIIPQENAPQSYPSHMNAPKSSLLT